MQRMRDEANLERMIERRLSFGGVINAILLGWLLIPLKVGAILYAVLWVLQRFGVLAWILRH